MFFRTCQHFDSDQSFANGIVWQPDGADWVLLLCAECGAMLRAVDTAAETHAAARSMQVSVVCADAVGTLDRIKVAASNGDLEPAKWRDGSLIMSDGEIESQFLAHLDTPQRPVAGPIKSVAVFKSTATSPAAARSLCGLIDALLTSGGCGKYLILVNESGTAPVNRIKSQR